MGTHGRRAFLRAAGATVAAVAVAGCRGGNTDADDEDDDGDAGTTATPTPTADLRIDRVRFVRDRPTGYREYTEVADRTYAPGETLWVYFEPEGAETEPATDDGRRVQLTTTFDVIGPDGSHIESLVDQYTETLSETEDPSKIFLFWYVTVPQTAQPGQYTAEIGVNDEIGPGEATTTVGFTVEEGAATGYRERFRSAVRTELDVRVRTLDVTDVVEFVYETPYSLRVERGRFQLGYIAGAYARQVDAGWDVRELRAETIDGDGVRYRWRVDSALARDFIDERITTEEFTRAVLRTLTEVESSGRRA